MDEEDKDDIAARINSVRVLDLEECSERVKSRFTKRVASLNGDGYETMVRAKDQDGSVQILVKEKMNLSHSSFRTMQNSTGQLILYSGMFRTLKILFRMLI